MKHCRLKLLLCIIHLATCSAQFVDDMQTLEPTCFEEGAFFCYGGGCVTMDKYCDGFYDCQDGSDENFCSNHLPDAQYCNQTHQFLCGDSLKCVPATWVCNNEVDCADGSDEVNCTSPHVNENVSPGSTKEALISKKTLKHLSMLVVDSNYTLGSGRYNYHQIEGLADDPDIDFSRRTMIYIGGYLSSPFLPYNLGLGVAYKKLGYNVIMLDTLMFNTIEYPRAARIIRVVGRHTATMLAKLTSKGLDPKKLELIGISLGGQTTSFIAKHYQKQTGVSVAKVVSLDAAGPCFRNLGPEDRLDKTDADFVINVATNIDNMGMASPVAHVNFYVNGGELQPGPLYWMYCPDLCSHTRAYDVWMSSIEHQDKFIAMQCDSVQQARDKECFDRVPQVTNLLGPKADRNLEGIFYLSTTNTAPYFMGKKGLKRENDFFISVTSALNEENVFKM